MVIRDKPSTKARSRSYEAIRKLMYILCELNISNDFYIVDDPDPMGWKQWVIKHTPPEKRGFTGNPKLDKSIGRKFAKSKIDSD